MYQRCLSGQGIVLTTKNKFMLKVCIQFSYIWFTIENMVILAQSLAGVISGEPTLSLLVVQILAFSKKI